MDPFFLWQENMGKTIQNFLHQISTLQAEEQQLLYEQEQLQSKVDMLRSALYLTNTAQTSPNSLVPSERKVAKIELVDVPSSWLRGKKYIFGVELSMKNQRETAPWITFPSLTWTAKLVLRNASGYELDENHIQTVLEQVCIFL
eukprot:c19452_g1_i2.p1 GENE.c19452_g1_i2~~c19452_g1_i2.p1  ORF type:complete len:144 (+),score=37.82 c19452_g1_i2:55-486(+)